MKLSLTLSRVFLIISLILISCIQQPTGINIQDELVIYPSPPAKTRIQYLTSFSSSTDFAGKQTGFKKFLFGEESPLPIVKPYGLAVYGSKIYICDTGIRGLIILDCNDNSFEYFIPGGKGELQLPINCDIDHKGNIFIADGNRRQIVIFDSNLNYLAAFSPENDSRPTDVKVDSNNIWVTASDKHAIHIYDILDYSLKKVFPEASQNDEEYLYQPLNIELAGQKLFVTDLGDCKIKVFDYGSDYITSFGGTGNGLGQFTRPKGLACDKEGNVYIVDAAFENIQIFNDEQELLLHFGGTYTGPGGMWLPADVCIDYNNFEYFSSYVDPGFKLEYLIYVSNQYGPDKISVYGFVGLTD